MKTLPSAVLLSLALIGRTAAVDASPTAPPDAAADLVGAWNHMLRTGEIGSTTTFAADGTYEMVSPSGDELQHGSYDATADDLSMAATAVQGDFSFHAPYRLIERADGDRLVMGAFEGAPGNVGLVGQWTSWQDFEQKDPSGAVVYTGTTTYDLALNADGTATFTFASPTDPSQPPTTFQVHYTVTGEIVELTIEDADGGLGATNLYFVDGVLGFDVYTRA
jgi:hypothetical protein